MGCEAPWGFRGKLCRGGSADVGLGFGGVEGGCQVLQALHGSLYLGGGAHELDGVDRCGDGDVAGGGGDKDFTSRARLGEEGNEEKKGVRRVKRIRGYGEEG